MSKPKTAVKVAGKVVLSFLISPQARRYEYGLAILAFEAIRTGITGHA